MDSQYRRYSPYVPKYLIDRPRHLVKHCLKKISAANAADLSGITIIDHGVFSVLSFQNGQKEKYVLKFGDENTMPECTCYDWKSSCYPCKHFFAVFRKFPAWQWDALSPLYRDSPYLNLDKIGDEVYKEVFNRNTIDSLDEIDYIDDGEATSNATNEYANLPDKKKAKNAMPNICREQLNRIRNLTYEVEETSDIWPELRDSLNECLALFLMNVWHYYQGQLIEKMD